MGMFSSSQPLNMKIFVAVAFLAAVAECRRHLCEDGTRPNCPDGSKAIYNRPTGKNTEKAKYGPPPPCGGETPVCLDGSKCGCPGGGKNCQFRYKVCGNRQKCRKPCKSGVPHCPWATKNRNKHDGIRVYNTGDKRPGNRLPHHWGPTYKGNQAFPGKGN